MLANREGFPQGANVSSSIYTNMMPNLVYLQKILLFLKQEESLKGFFSLTVSS